MELLRFGLFSSLLVFSAFGAELDFNRTIDEWDRTCRNYVESRDNQLSFRDVKRFVQANQVTNVRDFVAAMKRDRDFRPFLQKFILMHHSRSAQREAVDPEHPRVIFYGRGLLMAVTDHPTKPNPRVEVIEYDAKAHEFGFKQVDFSRGVAFDEKPKSCTGCHGSPGMPIWQTYRTWPGAYNYASASPLFESENPETRTGIYRHLSEPQTGDDSADLTRFVVDLSFDRIQHQLKSFPQPDRYRYAILGALLRCPNLEEFLGPGEKARRASSPKHVHEEVESVMSKQFQGLLEYATSINDQNAMRETAFNDQDDAVRFAGLKYFLEPEGVKVQRFSPNFEPASNEGYGLSIVGAGGGGWRFGFCRFIPDAVRADADLKPLLAMEPIGSNEPIELLEKQYCGLLREKSRKLLP